MIQVFVNDERNNKMAEVISALELITTYGNISAIVSNNNKPKSNQVCVDFFEGSTYLASVASWHTGGFRAYSKTDKTAEYYALFKSFRRSAKYIIAKRWLRTIKRNKPRNSSNNNKSKQQ